MKVEIQYCGVWGYGPRAASLAAEIEEQYDGADVKLIESSGGVFEVTVDGELVFSKIQIGRHAEPGEVMSLLQQRGGG